MHEKEGVIMSKKVVFVIVFLAICLGCFIFLQAKETSVAIVNGEAILTSDYDNNVDNILNIYRQQNPQVLEQPYAKDYVGKKILNDMIVKEVLVQEAKKAKLTATKEEVDNYIAKVKENLKDPKTNQVITDKQEQNKAFNKILKERNLSIDKYKKKVEEDIIVEKYKRAVISKNLRPVNADELKLFYNNISVIYNNDKKGIEQLRKNPGQFEEANVLAERLKVNLAPKAQIDVILVYANKKMDKNLYAERKNIAKQIKKEIDGGQAFEVVAKKYSSIKDSNIYVSKMNLIKGVGPEQLVSKAFSLDVGKISDIIEIVSDNPKQNAAEGFFIIKVQEKVAGGSFTYQEYAKELEKYVNNKRADNLFNQVALQAIKNSQIKIIKTYDVDKSSTTKNNQQEIVVSSDIVK